MRLGLLALDQAGDAVVRSIGTAGAKVVESIDSIGCTVLRRIEQATYLEVGRVVCEADAAAIQSLQAQLEEAKAATAEAKAATAEAKAAGDRQRFVISELNKDLRRKADLITSLRAAARAPAKDSEADRKLRADVLAAVAGLRRPLDAIRADLAGGQNAIRADLAGVQNGMTALQGAMKALQTYVGFMRTAFEGLLGAVLP